MKEFLDGVIVAALLVFALATMAGIRAQIEADPHAAILCLTLAFACNLALQLGGALILPGSLRERLTVGLILGNRNVGLVWSAVGAAASPAMTFYFAATQLPIYIVPRLLEALLVRSRRDSPATAPELRAVIERNANGEIEPHP